MVLKAANPAATIRLLLNKTAEPTLGGEGYHLSVTPKGVVINANQPAGLFYGIQTFLQLLPKEIESHQLVKKASWQIPCTTITDYPRYAYRGLLLDIARHRTGTTPRTWATAHCARAAGTPGRS